jgi:hypothetical protein
MKVSGGKPPKAVAKRKKRGNKSSDSSVAEPRPSSEDCTDGKDDDDDDHSRVPRRDHAAANATVGVSTRSRAQSADQGRVTPGRGGGGWKKASAPPLPNDHLVRAALKGVVAFPASCSTLPGIIGERGMIAEPVRIVTLLRAVLVLSTKMFQATRVMLVRAVESAHLAGYSVFQWKAGCCEACARF